MEQLPDIAPTPKQLADREQRFVAGVLPRVAKAVAEQLATSTDQIADNYSGLKLIGERPLYDADCRYSVKLDIEARGDDESEALFERPSQQPDTLLYVLQRKMKQGLLFAELDHTQQLALIQALGSEDDVRITDSDTYRAMVATLEGQPTRPVRCDRVVKDTYSCSEYDESLVTRQSSERYTIRDDDGFYVRQTLVDIVDVYDGNGPQGLDWLRAVTVDVAVDNVTAPYIASADDLAVMAEVLYYLKLPGGAIDETIGDDYLNDLAIEVLTHDLTTDLNPWRRQYRKLHQPLLDQMNALYLSTGDEGLSDNQQAQLQAYANTLRMAMQSDQMVDGVEMRRGDLVGIKGDQIVQYRDRSESMDVSAVYDGEIFGVFERIDVEMQLDEAYLQYDPATIMDDEIEALRVPFGLHMVLSDVEIVTHRGKVVQYGDKELYLPLHTKHSAATQYGADRTA